MRLLFALLFLIFVSFTRSAIAEGPAAPPAGQTPPPPAAPSSAGLPAPEMLPALSPDAAVSTPPPPSQALPPPQATESAKMPQTSEQLSPNTDSQAIRPGAPTIEERVHKISNLSPSCKKIEKSIFNCERAECKYDDIIDSQPASYKIIVVGPYKKFCKVSLVFENADVTKTNTFNLTKLEKNNLAAFTKEFFRLPESKVARPATCCSESRVVKNYCEITINGKRFLDILDDRSYFGCDGTKLFEVEQLIIPKSKQ